MNQQRVTADLSQVRIPQGPTSPKMDEDLALRETNQHLRDSSWSVQFGAVQYVIPGLGWHRVALDGNHGIVSAFDSGRVDGWGVTLNQTYQVGAKVIVAVDKGSQPSVILGQLPDIRTDETEQFAKPSFIGSWADIGRDVVAEAYMAAADAGGALVVETDQPTDLNTGDYSVHSSLGVGLRIGPVEAALTADEVTGLWANFIDQSVELSGRQLEIASDGFRAYSSLHDKVGKLQLGGELKYHVDLEITAVDTEVEAMRQTDNDFLYSYSTEPVALYSYNLYAMPSGVVQHLTVDSLRTDRGLQSSFGAVGITTYPHLGFVEHPPADENEAGDWYPQTSVGEEPTEEQRQQLADRLTDWADKLDELHVSQPLATFATVGAEWVKGHRQFITNEAASATATAVDLVDKYRTYESLQRTADSALVEGRDPIFQGELAQVPDARAGWVISDRDDGSIFIGNEHGAGIRLVGSTVYIEGGSIRFAAKKDIIGLSRDVSFTANRDVTFTSKNFIRLYSDRNVGIAGGISGRGGVLIESRSTSNSYNLPDNAQDALYGGVAIRSVKSHVVLQGGDVIAHAGATGAGQLVMRSDGGHAVLATPFYSVIHSAAHLCTHGEERRPGSATMFAPGQIVFDGDIKAQNGWLSGGLATAGNIQSARGRVADSQGGQVQKVQFPDQITNGLRQFDQSRSRAASTWTNNIPALVERLVNNSGPVSNKTREQLSGGFVQSSKATKHYGAQKLQPTYMCIYQEDLGLPASPLQPLVVTYKPDTSSQQNTDAWPGPLQSVQLNVPQNLEVISRRIDRILSGDPVETQLVSRSFADVFSTLKDE